MSAGTVIPVSSSWRVKRDGYVVPLAGAEYDRQTPLRKLKAQKAASQKRLRAERKSRGFCRCGCPLDGPGRWCSICRRRHQEGYAASLMQGRQRGSHCRLCGQTGHNARTCPEVPSASGVRPPSTGANGAGPPVLRNGPPLLKSGARPSVTVARSGPGAGSDRTFPVGGTAGSQGSRDGARADEGAAAAGERPAISNGGAW